MAGMKPNTIHDIAPGHEFNSVVALSAVIRERGGIVWKRGKPSPAIRYLVLCECQHCGERRKWHAHCLIRGGGHCCTGGMRGKLGRNGSPEFGSTKLIRHPKNKGTVVEVVKLPLEYTQKIGRKPYKKTKRHGWYSLHHVKAAVRENRPLGSDEYLFAFQEVRTVNMAVDLKCDNCGRYFQRTKAENEHRKNYHHSYCCYRCCVQHRARTGFSPYKHSLSMAKT